MASKRTTLKVCGENAHGTEHEWEPTFIGAWDGRLRWHATCEWCGRSVTVNAALKWDQHAE